MEQCKNYSSPLHNFEIYSEQPKVNNSSAKDKSLDLLIARIATWGKKPDISKSPSLKQTAISYFCSPEKPDNKKALFLQFNTPPSTKKRIRNTRSKKLTSPKITEFKNWLKNGDDQKETIELEKKKPVASTKNANKLEYHHSTPKKTVKIKERRKKKGLSSNGSFEELGKENCLEKNLFKKQKNKSEEITSNISKFSNMKNDPANYPEDLDKRENKRKTVIVMEREKKKQDKINDYKKYGIRVPSYDDIIKSQRRIQKYKENFQQLFEDSLELPEYQMMDVEDTVTITTNIDCTHMTNQELKEAFDRNLPYLLDIYNGTRYSSRHEQYFSEQLTDIFSTNSLMCSSSLSIFNGEQKLYLAKKIAKNFKDLESNTQYYFKVLLPDICLKIFMDEHNMTQEEAINYLDNKPVK